jgi:hypothetical protein
MFVSHCRLSQLGIWLALTFTGAAQAATWTQQQRLTDPIGPSLDLFGSSVAVSGDTAVAGAWGNNGNRGAVYVYVRSGGVWSQQQKLTAADGAPNDVFGYSVSLSGDTLLIGAMYHNGSQGAAYVFVRSGAVWYQQQKLTAADGAANDQFGRSVSLSGDTAVVGSANRSSAYVFVRSGAVWSQQQKLTASGVAANDQFGWSVSVDGDTAAIGAHGSNSSQGAAYVFVRSGTAWSQQQKLTAAGGAAGDDFGYSVSVSGISAVIGATGRNGNRGAAYVFSNLLGLWSQQQELAAGDAAVDQRFGQAVSANANWVVVGVHPSNMQGAAYVFGRRDGAWAQEQKLAPSAGGAQFGLSVAVNGETVAAGALSDAYLFVPVPGSTPQAIIFGRVANRALGSAPFTVSASATSGLPVSFISLTESVCTVSGTTVTLVATGTCTIRATQTGGGVYAAALPDDQSFQVTVAAAVLVTTGTGQTAPTGTMFPGALRVLVKDFYGNPAPNATVIFTAPTSGASGTFSGGSSTYSTTTYATGVAVTPSFTANAIAGSYAVTARVNGVADAVFSLTNTTATSPAWLPQQILTNPYGTSFDQFGHGVAVSGETAVISATGSDGYRGAAYVYVRSGGTWSQQQKLTAADGEAGDYFGAPMAVSGDTIVIGVSNKSGYRGAAYVFVRSGGVWSQQQKLTAADGVAGDDFGNSVSVNGDTAVIGARGANSDRGAAYVFVRNGGVWTLQQKLNAADSVERQGFGAGASLSGETVLIGVSRADAGAAYVFVRSGGVWSLQQKLTASGAAATDGFGSPVSLSGDVAAIGGSAGGKGAAYVFARNGTVWSQQQKLTNPGVGTDGFFGSSVSVSGNTVAVGAPMSYPDDGSIYVYARSGGSWIQQQKLTGGSILGNTVSVSGDTVVGGAYNDAAFVFVRQTGTAAQIIAFGALANRAAGSAPFDIAATASSGLPVSFNSLTDAVCTVSGSTVTLVGSGTCTIQAAQAGGATYAPATPVSRSFQVVGAPATISVLFGSGQSAAPGAAFAAALQASVRDSYGNGVASVLVTFNAPAAGASARFAGGVATFGALTDSAGVATAATGANGIAGSYVVTASVAGVAAAANFSLNNNASSPANLAAGKAATQSSTLPGYAPAGASSAVDGNTDGSFFNGSATHTNAEANSWWQVDLGATATVTSVTIWNRTDCCGSRLGDYWVFISDTPFTPGETPATLQLRAGTWGSHQTTAPNPSASITAGGAQGRYVRVQLPGANPLSLAEVQVFGTLGNAAVNVAVGKAASQSSTLTGTTGASLALDGNTDGGFFNGSVTHTNSEANPWWQVDLGATATVNSVTVWNRTDCCGARLGDYWVFISDTPFSAGETPSTLQSRAGTWSSHQTAMPNPSALIATGGAQGRYIRVQLSGINPLSLAEVQVFGTLGSAPVNVASGKSAMQSSTLAGTAGASSALDGNTDGGFFNGSVTHTNSETNPWWQVDLGATATVNSVTVWNRTDCCGARLGDYWVFISDTPFSAGETPSMLQMRAGTWSSHQTAAPNPSASIATGVTQGRYVRVQLSGIDPLSLAEVQVFGTPGSAPVNVAAGKAAAQSSTLAGTAGASLAVDGNTDGGFFNGSVTHTDAEANPWWQVDLGATTAVSSVTIWNRTDCCSARLGDYWVFISDTPFSAGETPATLQSRAGTWSSHQTAAPNPSASIATGGAQGRYVRVQLAGAGPLSLAEVQVMRTGQ